MPFKHRVGGCLDLVLGSVKDLPVLLSHVHEVAVVDHLKLPAEFRDGLTVLTRHMRVLTLAQELLHQSAQDRDLDLRLFLKVRDRGLMLLNLGNALLVHSECAL